jgi:hypothetical protein
VTGLYFWPKEMMLNGWEFNWEEIEGVLWCKFLEKWLFIALNE